MHNLYKMITDMENVTMNYDEAIKQLEQIMHEIETDEAMPLSVFKQKVKQARELIDFCDKQIANIESELKNLDMETE